VRTTITEQGQISIPAKLRREMALRPGQTVIWEQISPTECRLTMGHPPLAKPNPVAAIGFAKRHGLPEHTSAEWMRILREGEAP
jgi:AbrB family looped-hinge helix DNA binding protein